MYLKNNSTNKLLVIRNILLCFRWVGLLFEFWRFSLNRHRPHHIAHLHFPPHFPADDDDNDDVDVEKETGVSRIQADLPNPHPPRLHVLLVPSSRRHHGDPGPRAGHRGGRGGGPHNGHEARTAVVQVVGVAATPGAAGAIPGAQKGTGLRKGPGEPLLKPSGWIEAKSRYYTIFIPLQGLP